MAPIATLSTMAIPSRLQARHATLAALHQARFPGVPIPFPDAPDDPQSWANTNQVLMGALTGRQPTQVKRGPLQVIPHREMPPPPPLPHKKQVWR